MTGSWLFAVGPPPADAAPVGPVSEKPGAAVAEKRGAAGASIADITARIRGKFDGKQKALGDDEQELGNDDDDAEEPAPKKLKAEEVTANKPKAKADAKKCPKKDKRSTKKKTIPSPAKAATKAKAAPKTTTPSKKPRMSTEKVEYRGAYIYQSKAKGCFRAILEPPNYATEVKLRWAGKTPSQTEWKQVLEHIDAGKDWRSSDWAKKFEAKAKQ